MRALFVAVVAALVFAAAAQADAHVYLNSRSQTVPVAALNDALPAFQWAVTRDFAPYWKVDATLGTVPHAHDWTVTVTDAAAPCGLFGCVLGYHGVGHHGVPYAIIFAPAAAQYDVSWQQVLTHELFEMLVDPWGDRGELSQGRFSIIEVCDPVASWEWSRPSATGKRVHIADFVTPAWFRAGAEGPFDLQRRLPGPFTLGSDGYKSFWDPATKSWETIS